MNRSAFWFDVVIICSFGFVTFESAEEANKVREQVKYRCFCQSLIDGFSIESF